MKKRFKIYDLRFKIFLGLISLFIIHYSSIINPAYAAVGTGVDIGDVFGFGRKKSPTGPGVDSLGGGVSGLVPPVFSIATTLVIFYFLFGAFKLLKSGGDKEEVGKAREMITHAIIGFVLLIASFLVLQYLVGGLFGTETGPKVNLPIIKED